MYDFDSSIWITSFTIGTILIVSLKFKVQKLLGAVPEHLNKIENIADCRVLHIIDKLVTGPYWSKCRTLENILRLNPVIEETQRNSYCLIKNLDFHMLTFTNTICMMHCFKSKMMNLTD